MTREGTAEPVSRDQILRHARGQGNVHFPCSADHEQDWQPYPVDPYSAICDDHTYIHTYIRQGEDTVRKDQNSALALRTCGLTRDATAWPPSRDKVLRRARDCRAGQAAIHGCCAIWFNIPYISQGYTHAHTHTHIICLPFNPCQK